MPTKEMIPVPVNVFALVSSFLGTGVEFVEALTIVLAVGTVRGWKSSIAGGLFATLVLAVLIALIGAPLVNVIRLGWVQLVVGLLMLLFGARWLRKAILRYAGLKAMHDEAESYLEETERQRGAGKVGVGIDRFAFATSFSGTFLEGLEAVFIVITFGLSSHAMWSSVLGAAIATVTVAVAGVMLRRPMARIPENTMKFIVGVMLASFGTFWVGESVNVAWPQQDLSIVYLICTLLAVSWVIVARCRRDVQRATDASDSMAGVS